MKHPHPISLRLAPEVHARLQQCADRLRIKKHTLAQEAIAAVVGAIEKNGYRLLLPLELDIRSPSAARPYPAFRDEISMVAEKGAAYKIPKR